MPSSFHLSFAAVVHVFDEWNVCSSDWQLLTGSYTARDTLREWQDKNHPWLELTDIHRETTENVRVTVMPFYIGSRVSTGCLLVCVYVCLYVFIMHVLMFVLCVSPLLSNRQLLSCDDCLEDKREDCQNCFVQYCVYSYEQFLQVH